MIIRDELYFTAKHDNCGYSHNKKEKKNFFKLSLVHLLIEKTKPAHGFEDFVSSRDTYWYSIK